MTKQIRFNAFDMSCVGHVTGGTWRHPDNNADHYNTIEYWTNLAQLLEKTASSLRMSWARTTSMVETTTRQLSTQRKYRSLTR
jgi:hypothetical protein